MHYYVVVENDDGLTVAKVDSGSSAEAAAEKLGGVVVDPTPYSTYEDALDAMLLIRAEDDQQLES